LTHAVDDGPGPQPFLSTVIAFAAFIVLGFLCSGAPP
jgi:hypothetical protein